MRAISVFLAQVVVTAALPRCSELGAECTAWEKAHLEFQALISELQHGNLNDGAHTCGCRRVLEVVIGTLDGFALECQTLGRALRMALATRRMMLVQPSWCSAYTPPELRHRSNSTKRRALSTTPGRGFSGRWGCIWAHKNACPFNGPSSHAEKQDLHCHQTGGDPFDGITAGSSKLFNTRYYGASRLQRLVLGDFKDGRLFIEQYDQSVANRHGDRSSNAEADTIPSRDPVPDWERRYGNFWVRSQLQHFLWQPTPELVRALDEHPTVVQLGSLWRERSSYIGFHIRYTDNIPDLQRDFGRDARGKPESYPRGDSHPNLS